MKAGGVVSVAIGGLGLAESKAARDSASSASRTRNYLQVAVQMNKQQASAQR